MRIVRKTIATFLSFIIDIFSNTWEEFQSRANTTTHQAWLIPNDKRIGINHANHQS